MDSDLQLIKDCGFNSFEEVVKKINELVDVMRAARLRAEKHLDRFTNEAKKFLNAGQKDKAKKELLKKKKHAEKVKTIDNQLNVILEKLKEVKNSTQMLQVLNATKYCNNLLLTELGQKEMNEGSNETNENQDLIDNDKEITKYLEIIVNSRKKKAKPIVKPPLEQKNENLSEDTNNFPQPENNEVQNNNNSNFPQDSENNDVNFNNNNNFGINQKNENQNKINNQNLNKNININQNYNNQFNNNQFTNNQNFNNISNNNQYNNAKPNNNINNNNFNNNNYNFNNFSKKNPYDDIF